MDCSASLIDDKRKSTDHQIYSREHWERKRTWLSIGVHCDPWPWVGRKVWTAVSNCRYANRTLVRIGTSTKLTGATRTPALARKAWLIWHEIEGGCVNQQTILVTSQLKTTYLIKQHLKTGGSPCDIHKSGPDYIFKQLYTTKKSWSQRGDCTQET
jgi:hypothetical protein